MDQKEFAKKAEPLKSQLYRTAVLYLGSDTWAIDAVDEAIFKGLKACHKLREPDFFSTWLHRILINVCKDELRKHIHETTSEFLPEVTYIQLDHLPLKEAMAKLPEDLRLVIILRFFAGFTQEETAKLLEIPRGTVSTRQTKALSLLRLDLEDEEGRAQK